LGAINIQTDKLRNSRSAAGRCTVPVAGVQEKSLIFSITRFAGHFDAVIILPSMAS
jgi:hypothetical protein